MRTGSEKILNGRIIVKRMNYRKESWHVAAIADVSLIRNAKHQQYCGCPDAIEHEMLKINGIIAAEKQLKKHRQKRI